MIMMLIKDPDIYDIKTGLLSCLIRPVLHHAFLESLRSQRTSRMLTFHEEAYPLDRHDVMLPPTGALPWKPGEERTAGAQNDARAMPYQKVGDQNIDSPISPTKVG